MNKIEIGEDRDDSLIHKGDSMTQSEYAPYRRNLLALFRRLDRDVSELREEGLQGVGGEASGGLSDLPLHPADLGSHQSEEDVTLGLLSNEEELLAELNAAWTRLEQGRFGRCEACGGEIAAARLDAIPYARHCVDCAKKLQT
jgi:RNA polymerase-binding transcription factor DksA